MASVQSPTGFSLRSHHQRSNQDMRLDANHLRFMSKDEFRVLTAIEMGMKNHELVPVPLIESIAALKRGGCFKIIAELLKNKLIAHDAKKYHGYKLTYLGLDYLAIRVFVNRGVISGVGRRIGVGKESDIYECVNEHGEVLAMKIHRLGRVSFKNVKSKRDYLLHRKSASWLYMSRLAATREYSFLQALYQHEFPTPRPVDHNRHCIIMSLVKAHPFGQVRHLRHPARLYNKLMNLIVRLAEHGLIHGDFNEFNLMVNDDEEATLIDFPQMVSTSHANAAMFFERDVNCIRTWFGKRYNFFSDDFPLFANDVNKKVELDISLAASGFSKEEAAQLEQYFQEFKQQEDEHGEASVPDVAEHSEDESEQLDEIDQSDHSEQHSDEQIDSEADEQDDSDEEDDDVELDFNLKKRDRMMAGTKSASAAANANDEEAPELEEAAVQKMIAEHLLQQRRLNTNVEEDEEEPTEEDEEAKRQAALLRKQQKKAKLAKQKARALASPLAPSAAKDENANENESDESDDSSDVHDTVQVNTDAVRARVHDQRRKKTTAGKRSTKPHNQQKNREHRKHMENIRSFQ